MKNVQNVKKNRVTLGWYFDTHRDYALSVPGLSDDIELVMRCCCVDEEYDHEKGEEYVTVETNCNNCHGSGLSPTGNGKAILAFIKKYGD